jgi:hypothetical protein
VGWILASLVVLACDPQSGTERSKDDTMLRQGARDDSRRDPLAVAALRDAKLVVLRDGTIELYDRHGELRAQVLDPQARFVSTLEPLTGTQSFAKPHPYVSVPLAGLADWLTRRGQERRAKEALEEAGLSESQRLMVAIAEVAETTERELAALDGELAELWVDTSKPASERRRLLFELWDECEEGDGTGRKLRVTDAETAPDALREQAGERARATIETFIRKRLPAGSGDAFSPAELAALDARRRSKRPFDPYGSTAVAGRAEPAAGQASK